MEETSTSRGVPHHECRLGYREPFTFPVCEECGTVYTRPPAGAGSETATVQPLFDPALLLIDLERQIDTIPRETMRTYLAKLTEDPDMGSAFAWFATQHGFDLSEGGAL